MLVQAPPSHSQVMDSVEITSQEWMAPISVHLELIQKGVHVLHAKLDITVLILL